MSDAAPALTDDPGALIRTRQFRVLLVFAAIIGVIVSLASWGFLEFVYYLQHGVYKDLPSELGFSSVPWWWPLPWLAIAGALTAIAITRLPGSGGHVPADGLKTGGTPTQPIELPGILLAALASIGLGLVLGPEAPLIALGMGLGDLRDSRGQEGCARSTRGPDGRGGRVRRCLLAVRLPHRRSGDHHRGDGARRCNAASDPPAGPDRGRHRLTGLHRVWGP